MNSHIDNLIADVNRRIAGQREIQNEAKIRSDMLTGFIYELEDLRDKLKSPDPVKLP